MCCKMFQAIFVFKSSQGDVDTVTMEYQDPIITAISQVIAAGNGVEFINLSADMSRYRRESPDQSD